jgi:hypothetical protein
MFCNEPEVLIEGGTGTGKTTSLLEKCVMLCESFPGCRVLMSRKTRASMTESVLQTLEDFVLWPEHPAMKGPGRANRRAYHFPNGSIMVPAGMDQPSRIMSTQWDFGALFEATEFTENEYEHIGTRIRNNKIMVNGEPFNQTVCDCNPAHPGHWLNQRALRKVTDREDPQYGKPMMHRLLSRHEDNPFLTRDYLARLSRLTGVRRERYFLHRWVAAEGQIWPNFDPLKHMVNRLRYNQHGVAAVVLPRFERYIGAQDWGFRGPGCFQVWGVDNRHRMFRVYETYRKEMPFGFWADTARKAHERYGLERVVCDNAEPERIEAYNKILVRGGTDRHLAIAAVKAPETARDVVRDLLNPDQDGGARLFLVRDALDGADPVLRDEHAPCCTEEEIPSYVFKTTKDGQRIKEEPDPTCADHGCDTLMMAAMHIFEREPQRKGGGVVYRKGSAGDIFKHEDVLRGRRGA